MSSEKKNITHLLAFFPSFVFPSSHRAKTPIISAIVSSAGVIAIWVLVLIGWLWKQYKKRVRAKRRAARGLPPKVKKPKRPLPTFILPPDPAVITGQHEPGERAIPRKHGSIDNKNCPTPIELNERTHTTTDYQMHDEMIARQVFSKHSALDSPKHEKHEKHGRSSRCKLYPPAILSHMADIGIGLLVSELWAIPLIPSRGTVYSFHFIAFYEQPDLFALFTLTLGFLHHVLHRKRPNPYSFRVPSWKLINERHTNHSMLPHLRAIQYGSLILSQKILMHAAKQRPLTATSLAYLSSIPRLTVSAPFPELSHSLRRRACSSSPTSQSIVLFSESMIILSPSWTSAIGPPRRASGTTCPTVPAVSAPVIQQDRRARTDDKAPGRPGETPVGNERSRARQTSAYQRARGTL